MKNILHVLRCFTLPLCATLLAASTLTAQEAAPTIGGARSSTPQTPATEDSAQKRAAADEAARQFARKLLDQITSDSAALKLLENRAYLRASTANLLWKFDERAARSLFRDAIADLTEAITEQSTSVEPHQRDEARWRFHQLRHEVLTLVAARDPQLALDTLRATRPTRNEAELREYRRHGDDPELSMEQSLIMQVALNDPTQALRLAEASLAKGVTHAVLPLLSNLHERDAEAAAKLRDAIVAKLLTTDFSKEFSAANVAFQLLQLNSRQMQPRLQPASPAPASSTPTSSASAAPAERKPLMLDKTAMKDLGEALITAALDPQRGERMLWMIRSMPSDVEQLIAPARLAQMQRRLADHSRRFDPETRAMVEHSAIMEKGTTQQLIEAATKAPAEVRPMLFQTAAMKALHNDGDAARARSIITEHLPANSSEREEMLKQIDQMEWQRRLASKQLKEARASLDRITVPTERLAALAQLASAFAEANDLTSARELLKEAEGLTDARPRSMEAINARLMLARAYALVEPERTFQLVEPLIDMANDMLQAASVLSGFTPGGESFRDDEFILRSNGMVSGTINQYLDQLAALARADFTRTAKLADRFMRPEVQTMMRLLIAQSVLADRPQEMNNRMFSGGVIMGRAMLRRGM